jgi:hypothetical protein
MEFSMDSALGEPMSEKVNNGLNIWELTYSCECKLHQRSIINLLNFLLRPGISGRVCRESIFEDRRLWGRYLRNTRNCAILSHNMLRLAQGSRACLQQGG